MPKQTVLFDFDGVIADSFAAAHGTAQAYCKHNTEDSYRKHFEGNAWDSFLSIKLDDHEGCNHELDWWSTYSSIFAEKGGLFLGMDATVKRLASEHRLVIVSSAVESVIVPFLEKHGLREQFDGIYDADVHRSKSEKIGMIFEKYDIGPNDCVMITDSKGDILEAREKDVESIAVTWGFNNYDVLLSGEPFRIVRLPDELPNAVTEFFRGKSHVA